MARVPYLNQEDLEPDDRVLLERPGNIFRALAALQVDVEDRYLPYLEEFPLAAK